MGPGCLDKTTVCQFFASSKAFAMGVCDLYAPKRRLISIFSSLERRKQRGMVDKHAATLVGTVFEILKVTEAIFIHIYQMFLCNFIEAWQIINYC